MFALPVNAAVAAAPLRRQHRASRRVSPVCSATTPGAAPVWNSKWPTGVPPEMGGHKMPDGTIAPLSKSTGCGTGLAHCFQYHKEETDVKLEVTRAQQPLLAECRPVRSQSWNHSAQKHSLSFSWTDSPDGGRRKRCAGENFRVCCECRHLEQRGVHSCPERRLHARFARGAEGLQGEWKGIMWRVIYIVPMRCRILARWARCW